MDIAFFTFSVLIVEENLQNLFTYGKMCSTELIISV